MNQIDETAELLLARVRSSDNPRSVLRATELRGLYAGIKNADNKPAYGAAINQLKVSLEAEITAREAEMQSSSLTPIDVTAPMDVNSQTPELLPSSTGSQHPISQEIARLGDIFNRMGYVVEESREIDDQYHMFETLNFPKGHPARDDYDTFMTVETDGAGEPLIAPAHTSTMQNRMLKKYRSNLDKGEAIAVVVPDRVFRNEDLDARQ